MKACHVGYLSIHDSNDSIVLTVLGPLPVQNYPFKAPTVRFESALFHPNVDVHGNICLDILKEKWSAAYSVRTILLSIQVQAVPRTGL